MMWMSTNNVRLQWGRRVSTQMFPLSLPQLKYKVERTILDILKEFWVQRQMFLCYSRFPHILNLKASRVNGGNVIPQRFVNAHYIQLYPINSGNLSQNLLIT